jgi:hypothetical protein
MGGACSMNGVEKEKNNKKNKYRLLVGSQKERDC